MNENQDFEQKSFSRSSQGVHKNGQDAFRLMKWLVYYDSCYYGIISC